MRPVPDTYCSYHSQVTVGSFIHDVWESLGILDFWWKVVNTLAGLTGVLLPMDPAIHLLNDNSCFSLTGEARKGWLAGLTAAKRIVVQRWKPPHNISNMHRLQGFFGHFLPGAIISKD